MSHKQEGLAQSQTAAQGYAGSFTPGESMSEDPDKLTRLEKFAAQSPRWRFDAVAGAIGGITSGVTTCPLDVIKTKLQSGNSFTHVDKGRHAGHPKLYNGLVGTARVIWREEGFRGFYRGLGPIIFGYLPTWATYFTVYNKSKIYFAPYSGIWPGLVFYVADGCRKSTHCQHLLVCGCGCHEHYCNESNVRPGLVLGCAALTDPDGWSRLVSCRLVRWIVEIYFQARGTLPRPGLIWTRRGTTVRHSTLPKRCTRRRAYSPFTRVWRPRSSGCHTWRFTYRRMSTSGWSLPARPSGRLDRIRSSRGCTGLASSRHPSYPR